MKLSILGLIMALALAGCATSPPQLVSGNGSCHPSVDLPAHKTMKKVPEQDVLLEDLWALLLGERKDHAKDIDDYNSLYSECVGVTTVSVSPTASVSPAISPAPDNTNQKPSAPQASSYDRVLKALYLASPTSP